MQTRIPLSKKIEAGLTEEECCDILYALAKRVWNRKSIGKEPGNIFLQDDNRILIQATGTSPTGNLAFSPPEEITTAGSGSSRPTVPGSWFLLGMIAYYMYYKADYYERKGIRVATLLSGLSGRPFVIAKEDVEKIPFGLAVCHMTAVKPDMRIQGVREFLHYLMDEVPCVAELRFLCEGTPVGVRRLKFNGREIPDLRTLIPHGLRAADRTRYRLKEPAPSIAYRPGHHRFEIALEREQVEQVLFSLCVDRSCRTGLQQNFDSPEKVLDVTRSHLSCRLTGIRREHLRRNRSGTRFLILYVFLPNEECLGIMRCPAPSGDRPEYTVRIRYDAGQHALDIHWLSPDEQSSDGQARLFISTDIREEDYDDWS